MKRRGHNTRTVINTRFVYMTHEGNNSLPQWCNIKSSVCLILSKSPPSSPHSHFNADQGKDKDREILCAGQFFQLLVHSQAGRVGQKKVQGARTCQTDPALIHLVSGNTSSLHGKEGDA